jgi:uncharacterized membrane protein
VFDKWYYSIPFLIIVVIIIYKVFKTIKNGSIEEREDEDKNESN